MHAALQQLTPVICRPILLSLPEVLGSLTAELSTKWRKQWQLTHVKACPSDRFVTFAGCQAALRPVGGQYLDKHIAGAA